MTADDWWTWLAGWSRDWIAATYLVGARAEAQRPFRTARLIRDVAQRHASQAEHAAQQMTAKTWRDAFPPAGA